METEIAPFVQVKKLNQVAEIEFYHPASNSLPADILNKLAQEITASGADSEVKVILLRSKGEKAFCAGASFDELIEIKDLAGGKEFFSGFAKVINAIRKSPKLVVGRIHGKAVGGGVGIAAAVDYAFATAQSSIKLSELAVGLGPFVVGPAVERKVGLSAFSQLTIDASEWKSAAWAQEKGLFVEVHENIHLMDEAIYKLLNQLKGYNPEAMKELKTIFWKGTENWDQLLVERAEISGKLVLSDFTKNFIQNFKKK